MKNHVCGGEREEKIKEHVKYKINLFRFRRKAFFVVHFSLFYNRK
jgi:hypothetical protein